MCGIVGFVGAQDCVAHLVYGLEQLAYRGYDSAGAMTLHAGQICLRRAAGKLGALKALLAEKPLKGCCGLAHTRWATHGPATVENAHPQTDGQIAVVHNGILENDATLKNTLMAAGFRFHSQTDTEVFVHLIAREVHGGFSPLQAVQRALECVVGSFALVVAFRAYPDLLIATRRGDSPLVVARGPYGLGVASDSLAFNGQWREISFLECGEVACLTPGEITLYNAQGQKMARLFQRRHFIPDPVTKAGHPHFMHKEIWEQPATCQRTFERPVDTKVSSLLESVNHMTMVACGSSFYAGLVGKYWFERLARVRAEVEIASEFRYKNPLLAPQGVIIGISQSGETADVLGAVACAQAQGQHSIALLNVVGSALDRMADFSLCTQAGFEVGVAATKTFTSQLMVLAKLALSRAGDRAGLTELSTASELISCVLALEEQLKEMAQAICKDLSGILFIGRGVHLPVALEGALKWKELTYHQAQGFAAGELKHGPIALLDARCPVVALAPYNDLIEKMASNIAEVAARGAPLFVLTDAVGAAKIPHGHKIILPPTGLITSPFVYSVALQILAYHAALLDHKDVDQPRNLAKSVTVE